ncbi:hypothetical protein ACJX0J_031613 [Zea mays]
MGYEDGIVQFNNVDIYTSNMFLLLHVIILLKDWTLSVSLFLKHTSPFIIPKNLAFHFGYLWYSLVCASCFIVIRKIPNVLQSYEAMPTFLLMPLTKKMTL